jgi:hypothetical protein
VATYNIKGVLPLMSTLVKFAFAYIKLVAMLLRPLLIALILKPFERENKAEINYLITMQRCHYYQLHSSSSLPLNKSNQLQVYFGNF